MRILITGLLVLSTGVFAQAINTQRAQINYMIHCQGCHLADGSGLPGSVPGMNNFLGKFLSVPGGREFLVQVPGSANSSLNDADLAELLNWMLASMSFEQLPVDFNAYTESEVTELRRYILVDVTEVREKLVARFDK